MAENRFYLDREALVVLVTELLTRLKAKISEISESSSSAESTLTERIQQLEDALLHYVYKDTVPVEGSDEAYGKNETIYGDKYFYDSIAVDDFSYIKGKYITGHEGEEVGLVEYILDLLDSPDTKLVHTINDETIAGDKTFLGTTTFNSSGDASIISNNNIVIGNLSNILLENQSNILLEDLGYIKQNSEEGFDWILDRNNNSLLDILTSLLNSDENFVHLLGDELIEGEKTFSNNIIVLDFDCILDSNGYNLSDYLELFNVGSSSDLVHISGLETITGNKIFSGNTSITGKLIGSSNSGWNFISINNGSYTLQNELDSIYNLLNSLTFEEWSISSNTEDGKCLIRWDENIEDWLINIDFYDYSWERFDGVVSAGHPIFLHVKDNWSEKELFFISYSSLTEKGFVSLGSNDGNIKIYFLRLEKNRNVSGNLRGSIVSTPYIGYISSSESGTLEGISLNQLINFTESNCVLKSGGDPGGVMKGPLLMLHLSNSNNGIILEVERDDLDSTLYSPKIALSSNKGNDGINMTNHAISFMEGENQMLEIAKDSVYLKTYDLYDLVDSFFHLTNGSLSFGFGERNRTSLDVSEGLVIKNSNNLLKIQVGSLGYGDNYGIIAPKFISSTRNSPDYLLCGDGSLISKYDLISLTSFFTGAEVTNIEGVDYLVLNFSGQDQPLRIPLSTFVTLENYYDKDTYHILDEQGTIDNTSGWILQEKEGYIPTVGAVKNYVDYTLSNSNVIRLIHITNNNGYSLTVSPDPSTGIANITLPSNIGGGGSGIASGVTLWGNEFNGQSSVDGDISFANGITLEQLSGTNKLYVYKNSGFLAIDLKVVGNLLVTGNISAGGNVTALDTNPSFENRIYFNSVNYFEVNAGTLYFFDGQDLRTVNLT